MKSVVEECERLLENKIGGLCYPNQQQTNLTDLSKSVTKKLLSRHCKDKSALVAAALGDLPFTKSNLTRLVQPIFGKKVASAWKEINEAKVYKKSDDCVDNCIGLNLCYDKDCVQKRLATKGPAMSGPARAALVAWFSVLSHMIAGEDYPRNWTIEDRCKYIFMVVIRPIFGLDSDSNKNSPIKIAD